MVARIFIDGEAGTTGLQIRDRLAKRRDIELLTIREDLRKDAGARADLLNSADVAILCLPDAAAVEAVSLIDNSTTRVIDASTAHRVSEGWDYGFAEMDKGQSAKIAASKRVSNPGCWPQGVIATLRPLIVAGLLPADMALSVNGISGYTGGGKSMIATYEAEADVANTFAPYGLGLAHKHLPEMSAYSRLATAPLFVPAVGNYAQGMMTCIPLNLSALGNVPSGAELHSAIADHFAAIPNSYVELAPFEQVQGTPLLNPQVHNGTNTMRLHVFANDDKAQAVLMATYDNLGKGASGAAVQNLNLMIGSEESVSLVA